eukprot:1995810-Amphidinium_carterae.1
MQGQQMAFQNDILRSSPTANNIAFRTALKNEKNRIHEKYIVKEMMAVIVCEGMVLEDGGKS